MLICHLVAKCPDFHIKALMTSVYDMELELSVQALSRSQKLPLKVSVTFVDTAPKLAKGALPQPDSEYKCSLFKVVWAKS